MRSLEDRPNVVLLTENYLRNGGKINAWSRAVNVAVKIADIRGSGPVNEFNKPVVNPASCYFVPIFPLLEEHAKRLEIRNLNHLLGGVVPGEYMTGKGVVHGLIHPDATRPKEWVQEFAEAVQPHVLPGYTAFTKRDALLSAKRLDEEGLIVRGKRACATSGDNQYIINSSAALDRALGELEEGELGRDGYVIEANLEDPQTYVVGQTELDGTVISYFGKQRTTKDTKGKEHYGGSDLLIVRGDFSKLLALSEEKGLRHGEAVINHAAAFDSFAGEMLGMFGSERTYDVLQGKSQGKSFLGVTDPSLRLGGSTAVKALALEAFKDDPNLEFVVGSTNNVFFDHSEYLQHKPHSSYPNSFFTNLGIPKQAFVSFNGIDRHYSDPLVCYATLQKEDTIDSLIK